MKLGCKIFNAGPTTKQVTWRLLKHLVAINLAEIQTTSNDSRFQHLDKCATADLTSGQSH